MKKKVIIVLVSIFIFLELVAVVLAIFPRLFANTPAPVQIRLGIVPEYSKKRSRELWDKFFSRFRANPYYTMVPYYANSHEELINGFVYGSLDMIYVNPALYYNLKTKYEASPVAFLAMSDVEKTRYRAILVLNEGKKFLSATKGLRLTFTDLHSMTGYLVPHKYLEDKINEKLDRWFSKVSFSFTHNRAFQELVAGRTDMIALNLLFFDEMAESVKGAQERFHVIWMSPELPPPLICLSKKSKYYDSLLIEKIKKDLWEVFEKRTKLNYKSLIFEPVDFKYEKRVENLGHFLAEKPARTETDPVVQPENGE